jgi:hypothetical protein
MPNVKSGSQVNRSSSHNKSDIDRTSREASARDDLSNAYAGEENRGPYSDEEKDSSKSTNVKARVTEKSKERTPER